MLLPALSKAKQKAIQTSCLNNLKQWGLAEGIYATDNNDGIPRDGMGQNKLYPGNIYNGVQTGDPTDPNAWFNLLPQNVADHPLSEYYSAPGGNMRVKMPFPNNGKGKIWHCPAATMSDSDFAALSGGGQGGFFSYAFNIDLKVEFPGNLYPRMPKLTRLPKPSATVLMFDVVFNPVTEVVNNSPQYNSVNPANRFNSIGVRHNTGTIINFCDGHAYWFRIGSITNKVTYGTRSNGEPANPDIVWDYTAK